MLGHTASDENLGSGLQMRFCVYKFTKTLEEKKHALKTFTNGHLENYLCKEEGGYLLKGGTSLQVYGTYVVISKCYNKLQTCIIGSNKKKKANSTSMV